MFEFIQITAQYSNAVLMAILPQVSDFSQKLALPVPLPITMAQIERFNCDPHKGQVGGWLRLTNGFEFWYADGYAKGFASPDCYYRLQELVSLEEYHGVVTMNKNEAVKLARDSLQQLQYSQTTLYADGTPKVTKPPLVHSRVIPRYRIQWIEPVNGGTSVEMEIDAKQNVLKSLTILNKDLSRAPPTVTVEPLPLTPGQPPEFIKDLPPEMLSVFNQLPDSRLTPAQQHNLLVAVLPLISDYARKLDLPLPLPVTTNHVTSFDAQFFPNETYLNLTNGYQFVYCRGYIYQFHAPYSFFSGYKLDGRIEDYWGKWRMSEREATTLARETIKKLGYSPETLHLDRKPKVKKPIVIGSNIIPRYLITWTVSTPATEENSGGIISATDVEVDADKKCVKSISIYDSSLIRPTPDLQNEPSSLTNAPTNRTLPQFLFLTNAPPKPPLK